MSEVKRSIKCVVVGDAAVGKSYMILTYIRDEFPSFYHGTEFDNYTADLIVGGTQVELALWDTGGNEDFDRLRPMAYPQTDVLIMCFGINEPDSFANVSEKWTPEVRYYCPDVPIILVGTILDLRNDEQCLQKLAAKRSSPVTREQGEELAREINARMYLECSALSQQGLKRVFDEAVRSVIGPTQKQKRKACILL